MTNSFVISDTHFGHEATWARFKHEDGRPLRPFNSTEEMDETMVERWNKTVGVNDVVYHLGDVVINKKFLPILDRLNGSKRLIMGNHDIFGHEKYLLYFKKIVSYRVFVDDFVFSHIPLHPDSVGDRFKTNVHGHLHGNRVMRTKTHSPKSKEIDPLYHCVCVEHTDYAPLSFDELKDRIKKEHEALNYTPKAKAWGNGSNPG